MVGYRFVVVIDVVCGGLTCVAQVIAGGGERELAELYAAQGEDAVCDGLQVAGHALS